MVVPSAIEKGADVAPGATDVGDDVAPTGVGANLKEKSFVHKVVAR